MKKIPIILASSLISLWFIGNIGLYVYIKHSVSPEIEKVIEHLPKKLILKESNIKAESLHFMDFKMKFPFYKKDIAHVMPMYFEHRLHNFTIKSSNFEEFGYILFNVSPDRFDNSKESIMQTTWNDLLFKGNSFLDLLRTAYFARLSDYSWWNLVHNLRLSSLLVLKAMSLTIYDNFEVFDVETPYLNGILIKGYKSYGEKAKENKATFDFSFKIKEKRFNITFFNIDNKSFTKVNNIVSAIEPASNNEASYKKMESLFKNKKGSEYPAELLLVSMLSLNYSSVHDLEELLRIMIDKRYEQYLIDEVRDEIKYLKR